MVEISQLARLYIFFKTSREARWEYIRNYVDSNTKDTFQVWLSRQEGFHVATQSDLDEFKNIIYEIPEGL